MAGNSIAAMEAAVAEARKLHEFAKVELQLAETQAELSALIVKDARDAIIRVEDHLSATLQRVDETVGKVVLTGTSLERDVDLVRVVVARGTLLAESRKQRPEDQDYARWCLDVAIHRVANEIKASKPASDEKEWLKITLDSLNEQYDVVTGKTPVPETEYLRVLTEILEKPENIVDEEWLSAQREVLEAREPTKARIRAPQVGLSLTHSSL
jgi:hypothetical protein